MARDAQVGRACHTVWQPDPATVVAYDPQGPLRADDQSQRPFQVAATWFDLCPILVQPDNPDLRVFKCIDYLGKVRACDQ